MAKWWEKEPIRFECQANCFKCCIKPGIVNFDREDIRKAADFVKTSPAEFKKTFDPHFENPITLIAGEEGFLKFRRSGFQKIGGFSDIFTVKMHDTRFDATLKTIVLTFKTNRFLLPPFSHAKNLRWKITIYFSCTQPSSRPNESLLSASTASGRRAPLQGKKWAIAF
jgi:hypothetical protein